MIPRPFEYHAPTSVDAALALLATHGSEAKLLAGGHSLLPMMKLRFAEPAHLIDLNRIGTLKGIHLEGNEIRIGAMTSENDLIWSPLLAEHCPLLVETARQISDPQVRYRGTIGGDISHGDPGNDHPAVMLCLGASFVLKGSGWYATDYPHRSPPVKSEKGESKTESKESSGGESKSESSSESKTESKTEKTESKPATPAKSE